jgi:hypothetical protein
VWQMGLLPPHSPDDTTSIKASPIPKSIHFEDGDFSASRNAGIS